MGSSGERLVICMEGRYYDHSKSALKPMVLEAEEYHENLESGKALTWMKSKQTIPLICVQRITNAWAMSVVRKDDRQSSRKRDSW